MIQKLAFEESIRWRDGTKKMVDDAFAKARTLVPGTKRVPLASPYRARRRR